MASKTRIYAGSYKEIFSQCLEAIKKCRWNVVSYNESKGIIIARTGTTLLSWGEKVEIRVSKEVNGIMVEFISEPIAQLIDWGKSEENIQTFYDWLEAS